jgi:putative flippase GtrA
MSHETDSRPNRLLKFSLVGGIGIGVQLAVLAALTAMKWNYLLATALAVESAVVHNFCWHQHFTWADRVAGIQEILARLLRFHLSNGLISLVGNLLMMRFLSGSLRIPVIVANMVAITVCWLANFLASDRWVFLEPGAAETQNSCTVSSGVLSPIVRASVTACAEQKAHKSDTL